MFRLFIQLLMLIYLFQVTYLKICLSSLGKVLWSQ